MDTERPRSLAVLDLGSNSFHMLLAQAEDGGLRLVDKLREPVRLADGLDGNNRLDAESQKRALECLERFAQRIRTIPSPAVRVVGTNTLRKARNGRAFRDRAAAILGHPVEVISGDEEARLIYRGVSWARSDAGKTRLVIDIGGGSTEAIVGRDQEILQIASMFMGCVSYSRKFFTDGILSRENFRAAQTAAGLQLRAVSARLATTPWELALGASGTANALGEILSAMGESDGGITRRGLKRLRKEMQAQGRVKDLGLPGLREDRIPVLAGGLAIMMAIFQEWDLEEMHLAGGALREGLLLDILGRLQHEDIRKQSVEFLMGRHGADLPQASRVSTAALDLGRQMGLLTPEAEFEPALFLDWAARLHEVGLAVRFTGHHRHGAYLVGESFLPGFARDEQELLAALVRNHRRRIDPDLFDELSEPYASAALGLCIALRLAVLLCRSRRLGPIPQVELKENRTLRVSLCFEEGFLDLNPLTRTDLEEEREYLAALSIKLSWTDRAD